MEHEVGDSSVAVASFEGAAVDPLSEALAALDDRDYATAQWLFAATGRKDVAEAIKDDGGPRSQGLCDRSGAF